jgi:ribonuclease HI
MKAICYTDGACRQHGKVAAIGVSLCTLAGREVLAYSQCIGDATSNEAEYHALIRGLSICHALSVSSLLVKADSMLVVNQMNGRYSCQKAHLLPLYREARALSARFPSFSITHIERGLNQRADYLANQGFKEPEGSPIWHHICSAL